MSKVCRFSIFAFGMVVGLHTIADKLFGSVYIATMSANGLSDVNIGLAMSFASAALTIFDYPSGNIADIFGRKKLWVMDLLSGGQGFWLLHNRRFLCITYFPFCHGPWAWL